MIFPPAKTSFQDIILSSFSHINSQYSRSKAVLKNLHLYSRGKGGGEEDPAGPDVLKCARRQENTREDLYRHRQAGDFTNRNIYRLKLREIQLWHSSRSYDQCCGSAWINLIISINEKCSNKNRKIQENCL